MATDTTTPPARAAVQLPVDPERPTNALIPAFLLLLLVGGIVLGAVEVMRYVADRTRGGPNEEVKVVLLRLEQSVKPLGALGDNQAFDVGASAALLGLSALLVFLTWWQYRHGRVDTPPAPGARQPAGGFWSAVVFLFFLGSVVATLLIAGGGVLALLGKVAPEKAGAAAAGAAAYLVISWALFVGLTWLVCRAGRAEAGSATAEWEPHGGLWVALVVLFALVAVPAACFVLGVAGMFVLALAGVAGLPLDTWLLLALGGIVYVLVMAALYLFVIGTVNWVRAGFPVNWMWRVLAACVFLATFYVVTGGLFSLYSKIVNPLFFWGLILAGVSGIALVYVAVMYARDARRVGIVWATFLGLTRLTVYAVLMLVFLLPALQAWDKTESYSRVLILFDLSGSMNVSDEITSEGTPGPTRLDHVADFLARDNGAFLAGLQKNNPVYVYAFGNAVDLEPAEFPKGAKVDRWTRQDWKNWMALDLKRWVLDGLSPRGKEVVQDSDRFKAKDTAPDQWATEFFKDNQLLLAKLDKADKQKLEDKAKALDQKLKTRYAILSDTNYPDALMTVFGQEERHMLAGVVVVGDFRSTQGSEGAIGPVREKALATKTPIIAVPVGTERPKIEIRLTDLQAPSKAPPNDSFIAKVEVDGEGMVPGKDGKPPRLPVYLDVYKSGQEKGGKPLLTLQGEVEFKSTGGPVPHGSVEFKFDPELPDLAALLRTRKDDKEKVEGKEFEPGEYKLLARVPKVKGEVFAGKEHVSDLPVTVSIVKRKLRVLLVAGGPSKDFQFCRRFFSNERLKGLAELCVFLQVSDPKGPRAQDVPENQLLKKFPDVFEAREDPKENPELAYYNLAKYDVIFCFDPDWMKIAELDAGAPERLKKWVELQAGGLVYVAGIHTHKLTEKANQRALQPIIDLLPVEVDDDRRFSDLEKPTDKPFALRNLSAAGDADFMRLEDAAKNPLAGWHEFFYGKKREDVKPDDPVLRGFHRCYPSKKHKTTATVLATFPDPVVRDDGKIEDQPYIVTMPFPEGKVVYLAGEMNRLRQAKSGEQHFERFYTKLARYAAAGALKQESRSRGILVMGRQFTTNRRIDFEAKLRGTNIQEPLPREARPIFRVVRADGEPGKPAYTGKMEDKKGGKWDGWFSAFVREGDLAPGKYTLELDVPGSSEVIRQDFHVKESNRELDDTRPDKAAAALLASPAAELRLADAGKRQQLEALLARAGQAGGRESEPKLIFDLETAKSIPDYLTARSESHSNKGRTEDLWTEGPSLSPDDKPRGVAWLFRGVEWFGKRLGLNTSKPMTVPLALLVVVGLLSVEWLSRKLLKLA